MLGWCHVKKTQCPPPFFLPFFLLRVKDVSSLFLDFFFFGYFFFDWDFFFGLEDPPPPHKEGKGSSLSLFEGSLSPLERRQAFLFFLPRERILVELCCLGVLPPHQSVFCKRGNHSGLCSMTSDSHPNPFFFLVFPPQTLIGKKAGGPFPIFFFLPRKRNTSLDPVPLELGSNSFRREGIHKRTLFPPPRGWGFYSFCLSFCIWESFSPSRTAVITRCFFPGVKGR